MGIHGVAYRDTEPWGRSNVFAPKKVEVTNKVAKIRGFQFYVVHESTLHVHELSVNKIMGKL